MDGVKTTGPAPAPQVASSSEYERQRDENMRQNHAKLCALGLGAPFLAQGPKPSGRPSSRKRESAESPQLPSRSSGRLVKQPRVDYSEEEERCPQLRTARRGASSSTTSHQSSLPPQGAGPAAGDCRGGGGGGVVVGGGGGGVVAAAAAMAAAAAAALELRADGSAGAKLWLHPSLAFVDIYMLAGAGCAVASCLAPDGCSVRIEVGSGADVRVLELPMPLPPVCDEPQRREFFDCSGGVWWLRWMLEARRRHARMTICSTPPPSTPRNPPHTGRVEAGPAAWSCGPTHAH